MTVIRGTDPEVEARVMDLLATEVGYLDHVVSPSIGDFTSYDYQRMLVQDTYPWIWASKSRSIGWSRTMALHGLTRSQIRKSYLRLFVSLSLDEATEKIRWATMAHDAMPLSMKQRIKHRRRLSLEFMNGSRIMSVFTPRGRNIPNCDIVLDELAHIPQGRLVYRAATAIIVRGGQLLAGSSPIGRDNIHWEIGARAGRKYRHYKRITVYWWDCPALCRNVDEARKFARDMTTEERVERFGTAALRQEYEALPTDEFQEEFECAAFEDVSSYFPMELISACTLVITDEDQSAVPISPGNYATLNRERGQVFAGLDIGRRRNASEFTAIALKENGDAQERMFETWSDMPFDEQEEHLHSFMEQNPRSLLTIDDTGIGMQLGERMKQKYGDRIILVTFNREIKEEMAVHVRVQMERRKLLICPDRDRHRHIHSIRRIVTENRVKYDTVANEKHHADKFWSLALACHGAKLQGIIGPPAMAVILAPSPGRDLVMASHASGVVSMGNRGASEFVSPRIRRKIFLAQTAPDRLLSDLDPGAGFGPMPGDNARIVRAIAPPPRKGEE